MDLKEWTLNYIKYKDSFERKIIEVKASHDVIHVKTKDGDQTWLVKENLDMHGLSSASFVVCSHNRDNLNFVIKNWQELADMKDLIIIFVSLRNDDKVILRPYTHNSIADPETLDQGLRSMFNSINPEHSF